MLSLEVSTLVLAGEVILSDGAVVSAAGGFGSSGGFAGPGAGSLGFGCGGAVRTWRLRRPLARSLARVYGEQKRSFVGQHFWGRGYFVSTVGRDETVISLYIQQQEQEDEQLDQLNLGY